MADVMQTGPVVILPGTDELNRGDQALVWQTRAIAQRAGYGGKFYMLSAPGTSTHQSLAEGIGALAPILSHPQSRYDPKTNLRYGPMLTLIWGVIALFDIARSLGLLTSLGRRIMRPFLSAEERQTLRMMSESSACFVKGGGFIHSTASVTDPYRAYFFLFHVLLASSLGKKVFVMPNSFGPFEGRIYRGIVRAALKRCDLVTSRESISQSALAEIGIESQVFPDLAFGLASKVADGDSPIAGIKEANPGKKIVGLTARPYRFPGTPDPGLAYEKYVSEMARLIDLMKQGDYMPVFIEHVISEGHHESDLSAIMDIKRMPSAVDVPIVSVPDYNCRELKHVYGECDYVVGTRFHSVIFSLSEGTPSIAIAYGGNKGTGIMRDADLGKFVTKIESFSAERTWDQLGQLSRMSDIDQLLTSLRGRYNAEFDRLVEMIEECP